MSILFDIDCPTLSFLLVREVSDNGKQPPKVIQS
ncbi:uncharacterized protein METZ01_LOCUS181936, partial [marine metagenome]